MEASNELIKKLLEYNFIRINHEPYKLFQNENLFVMSQCPDGALVQS